MQSQDLLLVHLINFRKLSSACAQPFNECQLGEFKSIYTKLGNKFHSCPRVAAFGGQLPVTLPQLEVH